MPRPGIKILAETPGDGPELTKGDQVRFTFDIRLNRGEAVLEDQVFEWTVGDRNLIAGFRYGLEGMRAGGTRTFKASPHLCYRDAEVQGIPPNAVLICEIRNLAIVASKPLP